jgi:predicted pyridoxine 5'-phosphate oxidase superfamily flavin-nucleotide-binding protein
MITETVKKLLQTREFVYVGTSDLHGNPNVAPKIIVKFEKNYLYVVDYVIGKTWENLKVNPRGAISLMDSETLTGYVIRGPVELLTSGPEFDVIIKELQDKQVSLTVERIIAGVQHAKRHKNFEITLPEKGVVFKIKVAEIVEISSSGVLKREQPV